MHLWQLLLLSLILCKAANDVEAMSDGRLARTGQFPYMVKLTLKGCSTCGGGIISARYVLTAVHCVECFTKSQIEVFVGVADYLDRTRQTRSVSDIMIHPRDREEEGSATKRWIYKALRCANLADLLGTEDEEKRGSWDIAVLRVDEPFNLGPNVAIRGIAPADYAYTPETRCTLAGWGATIKKDENDEIELVPVHTLHWTDVTMKNAKECNDNGQKVRPQAELCTLSSPGHLRPGDSGGPLVCDNIIVGVVSRGSMTKPYTIFIKAADALDFINPLIIPGYRGSS